MGRTVGARPHGASQCGLLPQDAELPATFSVRSFLEYMDQLQRLPSKAAVERVLHEVELIDRSEAQIGTLSHGMRRRVALAQALLGTPRLLLLDEPLNGLDPLLASRIRDLLRRYAKTSTVVISSHSLSDIESICDHVVVVDRGRCVRENALATFLEKKRIVRVKLERPFASLEELRDLLPDLDIQVSGDWIRARIVDASNIGSINARLLPALVSLGAEIQCVLDGESLESVYRDADTVDGKVVSRIDGKDSRSRS
ncbi:MAG: ATP-binding cassette domain-containing protein [Polyangiales bacterium]